MARPERNYERSIFLVSSAIFGLTSYWRLRRIKQERRRKAKSGQAVLKATNNIGSDGEDEEKQKSVEANVSVRGIRSLSPSTDYLASFLNGLSYLCDTENRPDGYIPLCMAENKLCTDMLSQRLLQPSTATATFGDETIYGYNNFLGLPLARQAIAYFLAKRFLLTEQETPINLAQTLQHISPEHIGIGSGAAGVLNSLFYLLGDKGDCCLIPAPYYAAFENDMAVVAGIVPYAVHMANPIIGPSESELDLAYMEAKSQGLNPRFVLITNPNNPLGVIYGRDVLLSAVTWARKRNLHTIVDEIYALSTHKKYGHGFESIIKILDNQLKDDVHFVWSISKDFGASGLRFGFVYSHNETFLQGMANLNIFAGVSHPIQMTMSELLTDDDFVDLYLDESRARLNQSYIICIEKIEEMVLPFVPAEAGQFIYMDLSSLLPEKTFEWERRLCQLFVDYARLILTPGECQRERMPGMIRLCYAWVTPDVLKVSQRERENIQFSLLLFMSC
jgi:1-aminocyclopropane-1-carboxylate synthase